MQSIILSQIYKHYSFQRCFSAFGGKICLCITLTIRMLYYMSLLTCVADIRNSPNMLSFLGQVFKIRILNCLCAGKVRWLVFIIKHVLKWGLSLLGPGKRMLLYFLLSPSLENLLKMMKYYNMEGIWLPEWACKAESPSLPPPSQNYYIMMWMTHNIYDVKSDSFTCIFWQVAYPD